MARRFGMRPVRRNCMDHRWLEIVINARSEELDDLCGELIANGVPGLAVEEEEEFRAFLEENRRGCFGTMWTMPLWSR